MLNHSKLYDAVHYAKGWVSLPAPFESSWLLGTVLEVRVSQGEGGPFTSRFTNLPLKQLEADMPALMEELVPHLDVVRLQIVDQSHNVVYTKQARRIVTTTIDWE